MSYFKVGDRVKAVERVGNVFDSVGCLGTIVLIDYGGMQRAILVEFDRDIQGHSGIGADGKYHCKNGHGWWCTHHQIEKENKKEIVKMELEEGKHICENCGCEFEAFEGQKFRYCGEDHILCDDCFYDNYYVCKICGEIIEQGDEEYISSDGDAYCSRNCAERDFRRCYDCGCYIEDDNWFTIASRYGDGGEVICGTCRNEGWDRCADCDDLFRDDDLSRHNNNDCYYCDGCYDEHDRGDYDGINDYHEGPGLEYYDKDGHNRELNETNFKGYGFELEVDNGGYDHDNAARVCSMLNCEAYCCSDGSIGDGFEIISHPHTREAMEKMPMDEALEWLRQRGYRSHDAGTCGLHIHASKLLFGDEEKERIKNIAKITMFYEIFWEDVLKVSRRKQNQVNSWANKYGKGKKETYEMVDRAVKDNYSQSGRYFAVNLCNKHTVEFRLMRGTLKKETFWATLDFIMTTVENASKIPFAQINKPELWLDGMKPETLDYIRSRGAFASVVGQNNAVEDNNENDEE